MNRDYPPISIITVALNAAATMRDCIESVRNQDYPAQHIIVDGSSTDETFSIAKKYAPPTARIVSEPDKGLYDAMNKGLAFSTGDIIGTLNADDFYPHGSVLSRVAQVFGDPAVDACYGDLIYVSRLDASKVIRYWRAGPYNRKLFFRGWMPPHPTFFIRRSFYEKYGGYNLAQGSSADYELMLRYLLKYGVRAQYVPEVLVIMRAGGVSNVNLRNRFKANRLDRMAWKINGLQPMPWTLVAKPLSKAAQFFFKSVDKAPWRGTQWLKEIERKEVEAQVPEPLTQQATGLACLPVTETSPSPFYVITVNYYSEDQLKELINSLSHLHYLKRLIIVDHSRSECLDQLKADFPIQIIRQENKGYGAGLNAGLRQISEVGATALLCNPDITIINPEMVEDVLDYMKNNPKVGCIIPAQVNRDFQPTPSCRRFYRLKTLFASRLLGSGDNPPKVLREHFYMDRHTTEPFEVDWGTGSAMFFRASLFPHHVAFDESFFLYFEDVDLCTQMWQEGLSVIFYPKLVCYHYEQKLSHKEVRFFMRHLISLLKYIRKYWGLPQRSSLHISMRPSLPRN